MSSKNPLPDVKVGQIWADNDIRSAGRRLTIVAVSKDRVIARPSGGGRTANIRRDRFRPTSTGYRLVSDVSSSGAARAKEAVLALPSVNQEHAWAILGLPDLYSARKVAEFLGVRVGDVHAWRRENGRQKADS